MTFLHADKMGTVVAVSNAAGAVANKNLYGQFGESTTTGGTTFGFTGQRRDAELDGLHYFKRRIYSPKLGRFHSLIQLDILEQRISIYIAMWVTAL
ncbi:MAG: hypothetical protein IPL73_24620 [Candidatus Obscuribacter sp.]|nr:hypothetical protein [Candidatus Obscuribacter sp.]